MFSLRELLLNLRSCVPKTLILNHFKAQWNVETQQTLTCLMSYQISYTNFECSQITRNCKFRKSLPLKLETFSGNITVVFRWSPNGNPMLCKTVHWFADLSEFFFQILGSQSEEVNVKGIGTGETAHWVKRVFHWSINWSKFID